MGGIIDQLKVEVEGMKKTVKKSHRLAESSVVLMKHVNARVDAMLALTEKSGLFKREEFDMLVDLNLGLRLKTDEETIEVGDVAFVKYHGKDTRTGEEFGDEIPVRMGVGVIVFEKDLVGLKVGTKGYKNTYEFPEQKKVIEFTIDIVKVKTQIKKELKDGEGEAGVDGGADGSGGAVEASAEAQAESIGGDNGAEQPSDGGSVQPIRPEGSVDAGADSSASSSGEGGPSNA